MRGKCGQYVRNQHELIQSMPLNDSMLITLTVHLYGDLLSENFHAMATVVLVAHLTVKFFGTSVESAKAGGKIEKQRKKSSFSESRGQEGQERLRSKERKSCCSPATFRWVGECVER